MVVGKCSDPSTQAARDPPHQQTPKAAHSATGRALTTVIHLFPSAGESGLGKSTLINTLFNTTLYAKKNVPAPHQERSKTVSIESITAGKPSRPVPLV